MADKSAVLTGIARALFGAMLALVGLAFQAQGSVGVAWLFYLAGLVIGVKGTVRILLKLYVVGLGLLFLGGIYWIYWFILFRESPSGLFESHGPDWWSYFWWMPALFILAFAFLAIALYRDLSDQSDRDH